MKNYFAIILLFASCQKSQTQSQLPPTIDYEATPQAATITGARINEASGITFSVSMPGKLWVNEDSGNPPMLYVMSNTGSVDDSVMIEGATNRDWEEVALANGPLQGKKYLYIGEIGDNDGKYASCTFYRLEEPQAGMQQVSNYDKIDFTYSDGPRDAEAFLVEPLSKDIYIITKREEKSRVYKLSYPQSTTSSNTAQFLFELNFNSVVGAAMSADNHEVIIKTYTNVYHYTFDEGKSLADVLKTVTPKALGYQLEPQGEAVSFHSDGSGFFTLSEERMGVIPQLYFYKKKK